MRYAKALLLQLAAAAAVMPAEDINLRLLSAPDIEAVVDEWAGAASSPIPVGPVAEPAKSSNPVSLDLGTISPSEKLRWGQAGDVPPVGVQVQLKFELN